MTLKTPGKLGSCPVWLPRPSCNQPGRVSSGNAPAASVATWPSWRRCCARSSSARNRPTASFFQPGSVTIPVGGTAKLDQPGLPLRDPSHHDQHLHRSIDGHHDLNGVPRRLACSSARVADRRARRDLPPVLVLIRGPEAHSVRRATQGDRKSRLGHTSSKTLSSTRSARPRRTQIKRRDTSLVRPNGGVITRRVIQENFRKRDCARALTLRFQVHIRR